jgi:hypothetical protein
VKTCGLDKLCALASLVLLCLCATHMLWGFSLKNRHRPVPLMDYAPQEVGVYDTFYSELDESHCRGCHGDSLADRHHYTDAVTQFKMCTPCHEVIPDPPGVVIIRDCKASGCHSNSSVDLQANGNHHRSDLAVSDNCVACHGQNLVSELTPFSSFTQYPPSVVTPTPYSCLNCHWGQDVVDIGWTPGDPDPPQNAAGHPSTYDHYDAWNNFVGYWEYKLRIPGTGDCSAEGTTHSTGSTGTQYNPRCYLCHGNDPNAPSFDPDNPELIRYCETCHDIAPLHTLEGHVGPGGTGDPDAVNGWVATGYHTSNSSTEPTIYRTFSANELCFGCHGDNVPPYEGETTSAPTLNNMEPLVVCPTGLVEITGSDFGMEKTPDRWVGLKEAGSAIQVPIYSWTDTRIVFEVPAWTFTPGGHTVKVKTESGSSTTLPKLVVKDCASPRDITPDEGECKSTIVLSNGTGQFGPSQDTISGAGATDGIYRTVQIVASQGTYVAQNLTSWNNTQVTFKLHKADWFEDADADFLRDTGESVVGACEGLTVGAYSVYFKYIFYSDDDSSGDYTAGDTVHQVETSNPVYFELTNDPWVTGVNPNAFVTGDRVKIIGLNFGPTQTTGDVYMGTKSQYNPTNCYGKDCFGGSPTGGKLQSNIKFWSSTKIKVKIRFSQTQWAGKKRYVWVVKGGMVSNAKKVTILP